MGGWLHLLGMMALTLITQGLVVAGDSEKGFPIQVKHGREGVFLYCTVGNSGPVQGWSKDGSSISGADTRELLVGLAADDPRGLYQCHSATANASLQLYFRMCQNCVQLNFAVMMGMVAAEVVATAFLVIAVWSLAAQEPGWQSQASDKQALLAHEQLYQPLGERSNGQYSHIRVAKARHR